MMTDLIWILNAPSLMNTPKGIESSAWLTEQLPSDFQFLSENTIRTPDKRLGIYFEDLVSLIIKKATQPNDYYRNIKIFDNKKTIGEFDFVGRSSRGDFHLECAIKFYIRTGTGEQLSDYIGPGKKDRLDIKWNRLTEHQLPLSDTPLGQIACKDRGLSPTNKVMLLQGYLFHPFEEGQAVQLPIEINTNHLSGWWLRQNTLSQLKHDCQFAILRKPYWLTPNVDRPIDFEELVNEVKQHNFPILISRGVKVDDYWEEKDRGFVVPDDW